MTADRVRCGRCGREYDAGRFAFGRTLDCACGARVGAEPPPARADAELRFLADAMLGRLARWLRLLGFDVVYDAAIRDADLARRAFEEDRIVLTRDRALPDEWRLPRVVVLQSESRSEQLRELARRFPLRDAARPFTRCSRCNRALEDVALEAVAARLPPRVRAARPELRRCPTCERVYWAGSHLARMRGVLESALCGE